MKNHIKTVVSLTVICAVIAVLLGITNYYTAPIIKEQEENAANSALNEVMPNGKGFEKYDISSLTLPETVTEVYCEEGGGYVFKLTTSGYSSGLVIMCGVDKNGAVTGTSCIASSETLGAENTYGEKLVGKTNDDIDAVDTVANATRTTLAYKNAVKDALNAFVIIGGGSVDLRSEEEILNDNLSAALPSAEGKFIKEFICEKLIGIDKIYKAENSQGYVFVVGDKFVATDILGNIISEADEETKNLVSSESKKYLGVTITEIDIKNYSELPTSILKAFKTSSGNFIFEARAAGYGINGGDEWHPASGEYIYFKIALSDNGEIINCETTSQKETDGIGSVCADEKFYSQYNGKDETTYTEVDAISGATITTNGYKKGIENVFKALKILKGEA